MDTNASENEMMSIGKTDIFVYIFSFKSFYIMMRIRNIFYTYILIYIITYTQINWQNILGLVSIITIFEVQLQNIFCIRIGKRKMNEFDLIFVQEGWTQDVVLFVRLLICIENIFVR